MELDEMTAAEVFRPLDDDLAGPPRVDIASAIGEGRRRRRVYRAAGAGAVAIATTVVLVAATVGVDTMHANKSRTTTAPRPGASASTRATTAPAGLSCIEQRLSVPDRGQESVVTGADPTGRYLLGRTYPAGTSRPTLIWDNGAAHTVAIPGQDQVLADITSNGVAVGMGYSHGADRSWIYQGGKLSPLAGPIGSAVVAIGEQGTIAGTDDAPNGDEYPIVWRTPASTAARLPLPGPHWVGRVADVDADGTIVGSVHASMTTQAFRGMVWMPDGSSHLLPLPPIPGVNGLDVMSIRNGVIVGSAEKVTPDQTSYIPVKYDLRTATFDRLVGADLWAAGANGKPWLVGTSLGAAHVPAVWTPTAGIVKLPTLARPKANGDFSNSASTISDDGLTIGGDDSDAKGIIHAVVWRCRR